MDYGRNCTRIAFFTIDILTKISYNIGMRIINIETCLELMCGLLIEEEFSPAIEIAEKDKKILLSIAQSTFKGKALSDRQYEVVKKILTNGYQKDFLDRNVDLPSSINNIRKPLRKTMIFIVKRRRKQCVFH